MFRKLRLLDRVREAIRIRHYSYRTEQQYVAWIARYIRFHRYRDPAEMGHAEIEAFLSHLAVQRSVAAATQAQAPRSLTLSLQERARNYLAVDGQYRPRQTP